jgi:hypothetical protein
LGIFEDEQKIQGKGRKQKISKVMGMRPTPAETKKSNQLKQLQTLREVGRIPFLEYKQLREQIANGDVKGAAAKVLQENRVKKVQVKKEKEGKKEKKEEKFFKILTAKIRHGSSPRPGSAKREGMRRSVRNLSPLSCKPRAPTRAHIVIFLILLCTCSFSMFCDGFAPRFRSFGNFVNIEVDYLAKIILNSKNQELF